jgi:hypothetical protein
MVVANTLENVLHCAATSKDTGLLGRAFARLQKAGLNGELDRRSRVCLLVQCAEASIQVGD